MLSSLYQLRHQRSRDDMSQQQLQQQQQQPPPPSPPAIIAPLPEFEEPQGCFAALEIREIARLAIEETLADNQYMEDKITMWNNVIIDKVLTEMLKLKKPYKYIVKCSLQQRTGAGLHMASAFFWEPNTDAATTYKWDNDYIHCSLHVFGVML